MVGRSLHLHVYPTVSGTVLQSGVGVGRGRGRGAESSVHRAHSRGVAAVGFVGEHYEAVQVIMCYGCRWVEDVVGDSI